MDALHETVVKIEKDVLLFSSFWGKTTCSLAKIVLYVIKDVQFTPLHTLIDKDEIPTAQIHKASDLQFQ
ncbi:hypothetical protein NC651_015979 [Populus alba x Populus x berolinensis]|nr:hypothetical protein NC651_015979 [Populus alba x Populus x berolinensis]